jgi:hypothetical protein
MGDLLQNAIIDLRQTNYVRSNQNFDRCLSDIEKYTTNNEQKAFLLGFLFKDKDFSAHLPKDSEERIHHAIRNENLQMYFYRESQPEFDKIKSLAIVLLVAGILATFVGTTQLINGYYSIGIWMRYLTPVVHEGGTTLILGLLLLIGGFIRYRYERKRQTFMTRLMPKDK